MLKFISLGMFLFSTSLFSAEICTSGIEEFDPARKRLVCFYVGQEDAEVIDVLFNEENTERQHLVVNGKLKAIASFQDQLYIINENSLKNKYSLQQLANNKSTLLREFVNPVPSALRQKGAYRLSVQGNAIFLQDLCQNNINKIVVGRKGGQETTVGEVSTSVFNSSLLCLRNPIDLYCSEVNGRKVYDVQNLKKFCSYQVPLFLPLDEGEGRGFPKKKKGLSLGVNEMIDSAIAVGRYVYLALRNREEASFKILKFSKSSFFLDSFIEGEREEVAKFSSAYIIHKMEYIGKSLYALIEHTSEKRREIYRFIPGSSPQILPLRESYSLLSVIDHRKGDINFLIKNLKKSLACSSKFSDVQLYLQ